MILTFINRNLKLSRLYPTLKQVLRQVCQTLEQKFLIVEHFFINFLVLCLNKQMLFIVLIKVSKRCHDGRWWWLLLLCHFLCGRQKILIVRRLITTRLVRWRYVILKWKLIGLVLEKLRLIVTEREEDESM